MSEEKEEDKVEGMSYKYVDEKTGKETVYEVSYSQILQQKIEKAIKWSNYLKLGMLVIALIFLVIAYLVFFTEMGIVGYYLRRMVCPGMPI